MWDLVPRPPALGVWSLSHWTTREVPTIYERTDLQVINLHSGNGLCTKVFITVSMVTEEGGDKLSMQP